MANWIKVAVIGEFNLITSDCHRVCVTSLFCRVGGGGERDDERTTAAVQAAQTVMVKCGTAFVPADKSGIQECFQYFSPPSQEPFRPQLPRLCHPASHAR